MQSLLGKLENMLSFKRPKSSLILKDQLAKQIKLNKQESENSSIKQFSTLKPTKTSLNQTNSNNEFCLSQYQLYKDKLLRKPTNSEIFYSQNNKENFTDKTTSSSKNKQDQQGIQNALNNLIGNLKLKPIHQRQLKELQLITDMESQIQPKRLIEIDWAVKYQKILQTKDISSVKLQSIKQINNNKLLKKWNNQDQELLENQDYVKVNEITYKFLQKLYGGGPEISEKDIETPQQISINDKQKCLRNSDLKVNLWNNYQKLPLKPKGLENKGADCYLNAALQCLLSIEEFNYYFAFKNFQQRKTKAPKTYCETLSDIIKSIAQNEQLIILTKLRGLISKEFYPGVQQDCHELLIYLLSAISSELLLPQNPSIIEDLFEGQTVSEVKCIYCGNKSKIKEINIGLSVNSKGGIYETIEQFCGKEIIDDYKCDKCLKFGKAQKRTKISKAPKILIVQIKKFDQEKKRNGSLEFSIDESLNLQKVCTTTAKDAKYKLISFVVHKGWNDFGHYYAYCKRFNQWFVFDDEYYSQLPVNQIDISHAYLLFYQKI